jgi:hypothetical protein
MKVIPEKLEGTEPIRQKIPFKKKFSAVISVILAVALALTGTYAWQSFGDTAFNYAQGQPGPAGGRLHDDFQVVGHESGLYVWKSGITANKDIYVENYESTGLLPNGDPDPSALLGRDIYVRVKLYEYMEIGTGATEDPQYDSNGDAQNTDYINRTAESIIAGADRDDVLTWNARLPQRDVNSDMFKNRWDWAMGGSKTYMPTFNKDNHSQETDIKGDALDPAPLQVGEDPNATRQGESHAYPYPTNPGVDPDAGMHDYFVANDFYEAPVKTFNAITNVHETTFPTEIRHESKPTLSAQIMTMDQWVANGSQPVEAWVLDKDGWCYWASALSPQTATGLLLDNITLINEPDDEWWYSIYVKSEMATGGDWASDAPMMGFYANPAEKPTLEAEDLMNIITGRIPKVTDIYIDPALTILKVNEALSLDVHVIKEFTHDPAFDELRWSIYPFTARFSNGEFIPSAADGGRFFTVTATSVKTPSVKTSVTVYVAKVGQEVVVGGDGNLYQDNGNNTFQRITDTGMVADNIICPVVVGKPGYSTDRAVEVIGGVPYLPAGDGIHYWGDPVLRGETGSDGLLGTSDDQYYLKNTSGVMVLSWEAVQINVTPPSGAVVRGATLTLTAKVLWETGDIGTVYGASDYDRVTFTIMGAHAPATTITSVAGVATLNVPVSETNNSLTIRVSYPGTPTGTPGVYNTNGATRDITVTVSGLVIPAGATTFTDTNGVVWKILQDNRNPNTGHGTIFAVTANMYSSGSSLTYNRNDAVLYYNSSTIVQTFTPYASSTGPLRTAMNLWYTNFASAQLKSFARVPNLGSLENSGLPGMSYSTWNYSTSLSTPGAAAGGTTAGIVFPMSTSEVNTYLPTEASRAVGNYPSAGIQSQDFYYLRSPGEQANPTFGVGNSYVSPSGGIGWAWPSYTGYANRLGMRPAIWLQV